MTQGSIPVLICGAGPSGLMAACQLALIGITFRLIDKSETATTQSRALVLHARTLEIFKQMGIVDEILGQGEICRGVTWVFNGKEAASIKIDGDNLTAFPYVFCLEQSKTEKVLIQFLEKHGCQVERQVELVDYVVSEQKITAQLRKPDGSQETVIADYLIGADGAHSVVREKMQLNLNGSTYLQTLFVIDCQVKANIRPSEIYIMLSQKGLIGFFPMIQSHPSEKEGRHRYRVLGVLPAADKSKVITFEEIQKDFSSRVAMPAEIYDAAWISTYHAHHRHAKIFREGRCFIIGDAAHIHSPVGGQGMNTGLQDAYNLVWKLALVLQGRAQDRLLDTFNEERMAVAKNLVQTTDRIFYMAAGESFFIKHFRLYVLPWLLRLANPIFRYVKCVAQASFKVISEIGISYRKGFLSQNASWGSFPKKAPAPGDRFPFVLFEEDGVKKNIQDYLQGEGFHCFIFSQKVGDEKALALFCTQNYSELVTLHIILYSTETSALFEHFGLTASGYYVVRPDMVIACRSSGHDVSLLNAYLLSFLKFFEKCS